MNEQIMIAARAEGDARYTLRTSAAAFAEGAEFALKRFLPQAKPAPGTGEPLAADMVLKLARRTLWLAYVWNDHNFEPAHIEARKTAKECGIDSLDHANRWLTAVDGAQGVGGAEL